MVNATPRPLYPRERNLVPIAWEAPCAPGPVRKGAENLASKGVRSPERPDRSESLYRPRYPGPFSHRLNNTRVTNQPINSMIFVKNVTYLATQQTLNVTPNWCQGTVASQAMKKLKTCQVGAAMTLLGPEPALGIPRCSARVAIKN